MSAAWRSRRPSTSTAFSAARSRGDRSIMTAATGTRSTLARSTNPILSNRPMTGIGGLARKIKPSTPNANVVYNAAFYSNLLSSKTSQILEEMERLRCEIGDEDIRSAMEKQLDDTTKDVQALECQLADYQMAQDNARSGVSHDEILRQIDLLTGQNKKIEDEVDGIFLTRKKNEDEISRLQLDRKKMSQEYAVQKLVGEIEDIHEEGRAEEEKMVQLSNRVGNSSNADKEKRVDDLKKSIARIEEEINLFGMDDNAARKHLLEITQKTKDSNDLSSRLEDEMKDLATEQRELRSSLRTLNSGTAEQLLDKVEEIDAFLSSSSDAKAKLENDRLCLTSAIETLQDEISAAKKLSEGPMPSKNEVELMREEVAFTNNHLEINQDTVNRLQKQKLARIQELQRISQLEERMEAEMKELTRRTNEMTNEMRQLFDVDTLKDDAAARREDLAERCECFEQRLNHLNGMMNKLREEYEEQRKRCGGIEWVSFEENNLKLQQLMRDVFELNKDKMTPYSETKTECLELVKMINTMILKRNETM